VKFTVSVPKIVPVVGSLPVPSLLNRCGCEASDAVHLKELASPIRRGFDLKHVDLVPTSWCVRTSRDPLVAIFVFLTMLSHLSEFVEGKWVWVTYC